MITPSSLKSVARESRIFGGAYQRTREFYLRLQALDKSRSRFRKIIEGYWAGRQDLDHLVTDDRPLLDALRRDGVARIDSFCDAETTERLASEIRADLDALRVSGRTELEFSYHDDIDGRYQVAIVAERHPGLFDLLHNNDRLDRLASAYLGSRERPLSHVVELKNKPFHIDRFAFEHCDRWFPEFKAYLYLDDVSEFNAPMRFYAGSHRPGEWRMDFDWFHWRYRLPKLGIDLARDLAKEQGFREVYMTGRKGDLLIADTTGIHASSLLREGRRLQTISIWASGGVFRYRYA